MATCRGRLTGLGLLYVLIAGAAGKAGAQARSPVGDFLTAARTALNDLRYSDADSIARGVLSLGKIRRTDRIQALQLAAGASFPEQANAQQRDRAMEALRQLVRIAPSSTLPREVSWSGLDALLVEARNSTFGAAASPQERYTLTGPLERAEIGVVSSRPARFSLWLESEMGGTSVLLDSLPTGSQGVLNFRVLADGTPRLTSGAYRLVVRAVDASAPDTISLAYAARIEATTLRYEEVPSGLAPGALLPEMTAPKRKAGLIAGAFALAATVVASRTLRDHDLKGAASADGRAVGLGIALGLGTAGGVYLLARGESLPGNVKANAETRDQFARSVATARSRNADLLQSYRAQITVNPEPLR
jgi:hypothetical protein